jgi:glycosyltransferase involved in cell wall biosynthesis
LTVIARLERPLPPSLPVGQATALFCVGTCFHPEQPIVELSILADGIPHVPAAFAMPRPDMVARRGKSAGPTVGRSGFWGTVPIPKREQAGTLTLEVSVRLADGSRCRAELGRVEITEGDESVAPLHAEPARDGPMIAICMATFEPDMALFTTQIESLRVQSDERWVCVISDDCSSPAHFQRIVAAIGDDRRFAISRSPERLGFYRNFERALRLAPVEAELLALSDQDDRWHPDKLATLRAALGEAVLVYSDLRLVEAGGHVLRETLWRGRRNNHTDLAAMLVANTITGAAMLFKRELMELALPFPETPGFQFHDHWLAVVALAAGEVAFVDRPLYDYVQHPGAVFGDVTHGPASRGRSMGRLRGLRARLRGGVRLPARTNWRASYFYGYLASETQAEVLLARLDRRLSPGKRDVLERFVACDSSPRALAWLAARSLRPLAGRTETLGSELVLTQGVIWKMLAVARARRWPAASGPFTDASVPPPEEFSQRRLRRWRARV